MLLLLHVSYFFMLFKFSIWGIKFRLLEFHEDFYSRVFNIAIFLQLRKTRNEVPTGYLKKLTYPSITIVNNETYEDYKQTKNLP